MLTFEGYDPNSPTLRTTVAGRGYCLPDFWKQKAIYVDRAAPIYSGDFVLLYLEGQSAPMMKALEVTRDGKWLAVCLDGVFPIDCGWTVRGVERIVAVGPWTLGDYQPEEGPGDARHRTSEALSKNLEMMDRYTRPARVEWWQQGRVRGVKFPGLRAIYAGRIPTSELLPTDYDGSN